MNTPIRVQITLQDSRPSPIHQSTNPSIRERRRASLFRFRKLSPVVPYLDYQRGHYKYYTLFYHEAGRRRRETRSTFEAAKRRAQEIATAIQNGQTDMLGLRHAEKAECLAVKEQAVRAHCAPLSLATRFADLQDKCPIRSSPSPTLEERAGERRPINRYSIEEIFELGLKHLPQAGLRTVLIPDIVTQFLEQLRSDGAGQRWIDDLDSRLGRFAKKFTGPISELTAPAINTWLRSLGHQSINPSIHQSGALTGRSRNNYRVALLALISFAKDRAYLPRDWSQMADVTRAPQKVQEIKIFTPEQLTALLAHCRPNLLPFMAIQAFAGVRHEEITEAPGLDWRDINLESRLIYVPGPVAKAGTPDRIVPISDNLAAWLKLHLRRNGPVCNLANTANALRRTALRAKVTWLRNSLRKSFISYRLALVKNIGQVAEEAGNSPAIIKTNYRRPIPEAEAKRWFAIWPTQAEILQLNFAGL